MTSSLSILTPLVPTLDADPLTASDRVNRHSVLPPLSVIGASSTSATPAADSEPEPCDPFVDASGRTDRVFARQWTGMPIRAIVPLPRRKLAGSNATQTSPSTNADKVQFLPSSCSTRALAHTWDSDADSDAENEHERGREEVDELGSDDEGRDAASRPRCHRYESITAAEGLSAWSFEELRVECYAQSLVARGAKPPPVVQLSLAIPPAFVPRIVPRC